MPGTQVAFPVGNTDAGGQLLVGRAGWLLWRTGAPLDVRVRVATRAGHLVPVQLIVTSIEDQPLTGEELRSLPMGRLNAALRGEDLATAIERRWESKRAWNFAPTGMSTRQTLELAVPASRQAVSLKVEKSPTRKQPDAFYERVTSAYDAVRRTSSRPVAELAEANGVPASTIHRWLDEGRRRAALEAQAGSG